MRRDGRHTRRTEELASTTLEHVGLAGGVAVLLAAAATGLATSAPQLAGSMGSRLTEAVAGEWRRERRPAPPRPAPPRPEIVRGELLPSGSRELEQRWERGGGDLAVRPPTSLQVRPLLEPRGVWDARSTWRGQGGGAHATASARACALCAALSWHREGRSGATASGSGAHAGVDLRGRVEGRLALLAAEVTASARRDIGGARLTAEGRGRATLGAEVEARGRVQLAKTRQDIEVRGSAIAGASARAEAKFGVDLLGVAITQKATGEAWAGAGARGVVGLRRTPERIEWRLGWGAVLGIGATGEWEGAVDVAKVPSRHRKLAAAGLRAGLASSPLGLALVPLTTHHKDRHHADE